MSGAKNPYVDFLRRYRNDWVALVRDCLGADPDPFQEELLRAACAGERRISVRSGHGVGKTTVLAWVIICHALTRFPQKTVCTAPTSAQLFDALAAEVKAWINKLAEPLRELFEVKNESIELRSAPKESFISFRTSRPEVPEALAGIHSEHVLVVGDEASGIPEQVFEAAVGSMSGHNAITLLAGNPVRTSGLFFDTHHKLKDLWHTIHISCVGHPRICDDFVEELKRRYNEESNAYRVRVLGEFPKADDDTIIPYEWAQSAVERDIVAGAGAQRVWGLDCARFGADRSALAKRHGNVQMGKVQTWQGLDTMQLAGRVKHEYDATPDRERPEEICVDAIGLGAGVADRLRELGLPARAVNVSEASSMSDKFRNLRTELWWLGREWLEKRAARIEDPALVEELTRPKYSFSSNGKIQAESKDDMKKRGYRSPDVADAFLLTFAVPANTALYGDSMRLSWAEPLKRGGILC